MEQNQEQPQSPRGRGNNQRGRSRSRTRGGGRNYGSRTFQRQQQQQQEQISTILQENQQRSEQARSQPRDPKIHEYIDEGKNLVSKFFKGFEQEKRGNVEVQYDDHLPERISEVYYDRIYEHANSKYATLDDVDLRKTKCERMIKTFTAGITLATAIKLYKSSTDLEKTSNFSLNLLQHAKITIPEKAAVIINQLGKTDLKDDNRIRIINQNMACKRTLVKALLRFSTINQIDEVTPNKVANNLDVAHLYNSVFGRNSHKMIDNSLKSIQLLKELGREFFEKETSTAKKVRINSVTRAQQPQGPVQVEFEIRLPDFNFNTDVTKQHVRDYLNNPIFSLDNNRHFDWVANDVVTNIVCSLVLQIAKPDWIRNPNRAMRVLDNDFANTFIANATFLQVLNAAGIYNINNWIDDSDLNEFASMKLHEWSTSHVQNFQQILKMKEINFSEYGTDSQLVQIEDSAIDSTSSFSGVNRYSIKKKPPAKVALKNSESGAIFGIMARYIKKFRMTSDFKIVHDSNNRNILREFLKSDIVH